MIKAFISDSGILLARGAIISLFDDRSRCCSGSMEASFATSDDGTSCETTEVAQTSGNATDSLSMADSSTNVFNASLGSGGSSLITKADFLAFALFRSASLLFSLAFHLLYFSMAKLRSSLSCLALPNPLLFQ